MKPECQKHFTEDCHDQEPCEVVLEVLPFLLRRVYPDVRDWHTEPEDPRNAVFGEIPKTEPVPH